MQHAEVMPGRQGVVGHSARADGAAPPARTLAVLTAAVAMLHLSALVWAPSGLEPEKQPRDATPSFITRMVAAPAPPPAAPVPPPPAPAVAPKKAPKPTPKPPPADVPPTPDATESVATTSVVVPSPFSIGPFAAPPATPAPAAPTVAADSGVGTGGSGTAAPAAPATAPAPPPVGIAPSVRMTYTATGVSKGLTYHATSELLWQQDGGRYDARMDVSAFLIGAMVQTSSGRLDSSGLVPERFSDKRGRSSEQAAHFDRAQNRIVYSSNTPPTTLAPGAQDRLGVFMQLGALLAGDASRYPVGSAIELQTVGTRDAEAWVFQVEQAETLNLPAGSTDTLRLARAPRKDFDTRVEVWYAPLLGYLPVRIRITQASGDYVDQQLKGLGRP